MGYDCMNGLGSCGKNQDISACTLSCLAGGAFDAHITEMCDVLLCSMQ